MHRLPYSLSHLPVLMYIFPFNTYYTFMPFIPFLPVGDSSPLVQAVLKEFLTHFPQIAWLTLITLF